jgi:hypothetical protein
MVVSGRRRGFDRAVAILLALLAVGIGGCGGGGGGGATDPEKAADVAVLNDLLARELTAIEAYRGALPLLRGRALAVARELRGQDQAHVDALTKVIRGLGGEVEAEAAELQPPPKGRAAALTLAYEVENAALGDDLGAPARLRTPAPRSVTPAVAASHAQHLTILRQLLGAGLAAAVPEPFESGSQPPPGKG